MDTIETSEQINRDRRRFLGAAAMTLATAQFGMVGSADAESSKAMQSHKRIDERQ